MGQGDGHRPETYRLKNPLVKTAVVFVVSTWISCRDFSLERALPDIRDEGTSGRYVFNLCWNDEHIGTLKFIYGLVCY